MTALADFATLSRPAATAATVLRGAMVRVEQEKIPMWFQLGASKQVGIMLPTNNQADERKAT
jgi:hypothetical protein